MSGAVSVQPGSEIIAPSPHPGMGAALVARGCSFRVWAPHADQVAVTGPFAVPAWSPQGIRLEREPGAGRDYWSVFVPGLGAGVPYKFVLRRGQELLWRLDPYGRDATSLDGDSLTTDPRFDWGGDAFQMPPWSELVIYELHVATFNNEPPPGATGTFDELLEELDYLRELGINAVEIMPAVEFDTPTSMGYNPALLFAIEGAYGDPQSFRRFVKAAHARGIAVILDVVFNHLGPEGLDSCLGRFDGWHVPGKQGIYFYADDRSETPFGDRPDFGRPEVRQILRDNALSWLHEYRVDGLRLDSTIGIRRAVGKGVDRGDIPEGWALLQWIARDKGSAQPWKLLIAEDLQDDEWLTRPAWEGGAGCDSQWDTRFHAALRDALTAARDEDRDLGRVRDALTHRFNGDAFERVIFSESHDEVTARDGVELGRMPRKIAWHDAEGWAARKRSTLGAGLVLTAPGIPMIFQGQEFLEWWTWTDRTPLDWSKELRFAGIKQLYRDLIRLRRNFWNNTRGLRGQHIHVFHVNFEDKVLAFQRWAEGGPGDDVVVVANFGSSDYAAYNVGFPSAGTWYLRFNSDYQGYSGDFGNRGYDTHAEALPNQGLPASGNVGLGPYSLLIYSQ
jgi:1,4-alpha-glucan branching enzyme